MHENGSFLDDRTLQDIGLRLARIEGQVRGIQRMTVQERGLPELMGQIVAVRAALKKVAGMVLDSHIKHRAIGAADNGGIEPEELADLLRLFNRYYA